MYRSAAGIATHIRDGPLQKRGELLLFLFREALNDPLLIVYNGVVHFFVALLPFRQYIDPLAAAILRIWPEFDESFPLQPGQEPRNRWMAQVEGLLNIFAAGRLFSVS